MRILEFIFLLNRQGYLGLVEELGGEFCVPNAVVGPAQC